MVNRRDEAAVSRWGLPRGSAAQDELPRQAVIRTLDGRLGLSAIAGRWLGVDFVPASPNKPVEGTNWMYEVELPENVEPVLPEDGVFSEVRWVERTAIGELVVDHALRRIKQTLLAAETGRVVELHLGKPV
jgi:ADP-ribose pyrophosphatase YjhB (NUDIX family)